MPKTNAQRQAAHRQRQTRRLAVLQARCAALEAERDHLQTDLDAALAECERLALTTCRHPAAAVDAAHAGHAAPRSGSRTPI